MEEQRLRELRLQILDVGDRGAIEELVHGLGPWVKAICRTTGLTPDECEDAVQEFFTKLWDHGWKALAAWGGQATMRGYLRVIARRTALDLRRRRTAAATTTGEQPETASQDPGPLDIAEAVEDRRMLFLAMSRLSPPDSHILTMRLFQGLGHQEIADKLAIRLNAASVRLSRAEKRLEVHLRKIAGEEPTWN